MADKDQTLSSKVIATWVKRCHLATRVAMDNALRPYDLGATQWYVLQRLAQEGPTLQRELQRLLQVERATLSAVVGALVRKGLIAQVPDRMDQRQKLLQITSPGRMLWDQLPDLGVICNVAFGGLDADTIANTVAVLQAATDRLEAFSAEEGDL